jgi:hypothetical protein
MEDAKLVPCNEKDEVGLWQRHQLLFAVSRMVYNDVIQDAGNT